jgi:putative hydrolase of the HAD superfamily
MGGHGGLEGELALVLRACEVELGPRQLQEMVQHELESWRTNVHLFDDSLVWLSILREHGIRTAIVSNCSSQAGEVVRWLGLGSYVDAVLLSCEVGLLKPDPAFYRLALERVGGQPESTLLVDDQRLNLDAARDLGLRTVLMQRYASVNAEPGGHPAISALAQLEALLGVAPGA